MIAFVMTMRDVLGHGVSQVPLAERSDAIATFRFDGPEEALGRRRWHWAPETVSARHVLRHLQHLPHVSAPLVITIRRPKSCVVRRSSQGALRRPSHTYSHL